MCCVGICWYRTSTIPCVPIIKAVTDQDNEQTTLQSPRNNNPSLHKKFHTRSTRRQRFLHNLLDTIHLHVPHTTHLLRRPKLSPTHNRNGRESRSRIPIFLHETRRCRRGLCRIVSGVGAVSSHDYVGSSRGGIDCCHWERWITNIHRRRNESRLWIFAWV